MADSPLASEGFAIGLIAVLQNIMPAVLSVASLYGVSIAYGVEFSREYVDLSILVFVLTLLILKSSRGVGVQHVAPVSSPLGVSIVLRWGLLLVVLLAVGYVAKESSQYSRRIILTWSVVTPVLLVATAHLLRGMLRRILSDPENMRSAVIAGVNEVSLALATRLAGQPEQGLRVAGFFDDRSGDRLGMGTGTEPAGRLVDLPAFVKQHNIDVIFVALPMRHVQRVLNLLDELRDTTASIYYVPDVFVFDLIQARTGEILGMPVVAMCETPFFGIRGAIKRAIDFVLASAGLLLLLPFMLAVAIAVRLSSPGPIIFRQKRYGLDGLEISVYKFRTMKVVENGQLVRQATKDDDRVTPIGRVLRRYSIDELPQLINVIQGRMSLVGPRPHAVAHNEEYRKLIKGYMIRHKVRPGITGLAQVNGCRGETSRLEEMEARVEYDLEYLRRWSPTLDMRIILLTVLQLLNDKKAY